MAASAGRTTEVHQHARAIAGLRLTPEVHLSSNKELSQHRKYAAGRAFGAAANVSGASAPCASTKGAFSDASSDRSRDAKRNASEPDTQPAPGSPADGTVKSLDDASVESESCEKPKLHWQLLPRHGCTVKEMVCVDQVGLQSQAPDSARVILLSVASMIDVLRSCAGPFHCLWR